MKSGTARSEPGCAGGAPDSAAATTWASYVAIAVALALVVAAIFIGTLRGEFVYDDDGQIVQNAFLQDPSLNGKALMSDVWAFKGDRGHAWSNYWHPTFVAWLIVNANLFGVDNPVGWHVMNVLLHCLVPAMAFGLMRTLGMGRWLAAGAALVFAAHPAHVESVAWISGSPDMLMSIGLIGVRDPRLRRPADAPAARARGAGAGGAVRQVGIPRVRV